MRHVALTATLLLAAISTPIHGQDPAPIRLVGHDVALTLMRLADRSLVAWTDPSATLDTEKIPWSAQTSLSDAIARNGIDPDTHAYTLVYDLNPGLRKPADATPGMSIVLPKIKAGPSLQQQLTSGTHIVRLVVDGPTRRRLQESTDRLLNAGQLLRRDSPPPSGNPSLANQAIDVIGWFRQIAVVEQNRRGPVTSIYSLEALSAEADATAAIVEKMQRARGTTTNADERQLGAIHGDVKRENERYVERLSGTVPTLEDYECCKVTVTIAGADAATLSRLRVYYTLNGLFRPPPPAPAGWKPFADIGSGRTQLLRGKNYQFWAAPDGQPERPVTAPLLVQVVSTSSPLAVTLRVRR